jgi:peroxiredoxin Q/BCP
VEGCGFRDLAEEYAAKDAVVIGISFDSQSLNRSWAEKNKFEFSLLSDLERTVARAYGAADETSESARRAAAIVGPDGKITHWFARVSPRAFPEEALELL